MSPPRTSRTPLLLALLAGGIAAWQSSVQADGRGPSPAPLPIAFDSQIAANANQMLEEGRQTFRFDTFGDEEFWGGALQLHAAIAGAANGGTGPGVSPDAALSVGLQVDVDALPPSVLDALQAGTLDLDDPANTVALLQLNSVVGVTGFFSEPGNQLTSLGIQCSLCHSSVDDSF